MTCWSNKEGTSDGPWQHAHHPRGRADPGARGWRAQGTQGSPRSALGSARTPQHAARLPLSDALPLLIALLVGLVAWALMRRDTKKPSPPAPVAPPPTPV